MAEKQGSGKKKGKRMVDTNVRITKETHSRLKTLADMLGLTMSDAINFVIIEHYPEVDNERTRREERRRTLARKTDKTDD